MTRIKLCGLSRPCDIWAANELKPEYIGFVFAPGSRRYVSPGQAAQLKAGLSRECKVVGVFVNEKPQNVAELLNRGLIDLAQLHGSEDEDYIGALRRLTEKPLIQAICVSTEADMIRAKRSSADYVLLDSGRGGTGTTFDWQLAQDLEREYFLAGGLTPYNVRPAIEILHPFCVDVSSGIETDGLKDKAKMQAFVAAARRSAVAE